MCSLYFTYYKFYLYLEKLLLQKCTEICQYIVSWRCAYSLPFLQNLTVPIVQYNVKFCIDVDKLNDVPFNI